MLLQLSMSVLTSLPSLFNYTVCVTSSDTGPRKCPSFPMLPTRRSQRQSQGAQSLSAINCSIYAVVHCCMSLG